MFSVVADQPWTGNGCSGEHKPRSYQLEMLDKSMQGNIIVAMDTGSGKTQIAILRIAAELDRCLHNKIVWFLAPTVALCMQQHIAIVSQLPAVRTLLLVGSDNVDRWSEQRIWDAALENVRVVVSTHAVLADALTHGFVTMTNLALLIFDEAHHCARQHPANKIMRDFYHPDKSTQGSHSVPHILGLTASPIMRSKISELRLIETNLDSISQTPRLHRQELLRHVHRPLLRQLLYSERDSNDSVSTSVALHLLSSLHQATCGENDGSLLALPSSLTLRGSSRNIPWTDQLHKFYRKSVHIYRELGSWAADYFIMESIAILRDSLRPESGFALGMREDEKALLLQALDPVAASMDSATPDIETDLSLSAKLVRLISFLGEQNHEQCSGLVFVRQRATVGVLSKLLSIHPETRDRFRCATFVGLSNSAQRKYTMAEMLDLKTQHETLAQFKLGEKNLIIATEVLEEGIDVTACNLVICFDPPPNLKSFVQRRGRARKEESTFAIMVVAEADNTAAKITSWQDLEQEMIRTYQNEMRSLRGVNEIEHMAEDVEGEIVVPSTGARLTADSAMGHLYHFCALLPRLSYADLRPTFQFTEQPGDLVLATVTLPNCVSSLVRTATSARAWRSERAAMKDAAFQAYCALFQAGLLNQHLLPLSHEQEMIGAKLEELPAIVEVRPQFNPWSDFVDAWSCSAVYETVITVQEHRSDEVGYEGSFILATPLPIPPVHPFDLYWNATSAFTVHLRGLREVVTLRPETLRSLREVTQLIHRSFRSDRTIDNRTDFVSLFSPARGWDDIAAWLAVNRGRRSALAEFETHGGPCRGFVRTRSGDGVPYLFQRWDTPPGDDPIRIKCFPLPRRRNFLSRSTLSEDSMPLSSEERTCNLSKVETFLACDSTVDLLPLEVARFGLFIPAILQHIELRLVAKRLCATILKEVHYKDIQHVATAIICPSAQWLTNYQRYEFIGDSVLKFAVSCQLFRDHRHWHEGYLSEARSQLVSNNSLALAAIREGLDAYIMTQPLKSGRNSPLLISDIQKSGAEKRKVSAKVLADVTEALIGAAFVDGGFHVARSCIHTFLPAVSLQQPSFNASYPEHPSFGSIDTAESLLGYQFHCKALLLEALTHPACERDLYTESYQRLEFLGDAVLDMLVAATLATQNLSQGAMTRIKAALVNANLLGFCCMDFSIDQNVKYIHEESTGVFKEKCRTEQLQLWKFMRHHHQEVADAQERCWERYQQLLHNIRLSMDQGMSYPWVELTRLSPDKFYSDLIESTLGAIFVDSQGDLAVCQSFIERIGVARYLRRMVAEGVDIVHPRDALERASGSNKVQYSIDLEDNGLGTYRCTISVNGSNIVEVRDCSTKDESMVAAAEAATKLLLNADGSRK